MTETDSQLEDARSSDSSSSGLDQRWATILILAWLLAGFFTLVFNAVRREPSFFDQLYRKFGFVWLPAYTFIYAAILTSAWCRLVRRKQVEPQDAIAVFVTGTTAPYLLELLVNSLACRTNLEMSHAVQFRNVTMVWFLGDRW